MIAWGIYLLKVSACLAAFYTLYHVAFKNNTFFTLNRLYLSGTLVVSFLIPLLNLSIVTKTGVIPVDYLAEKPFGEYGNLYPIQQVIETEVRVNYVLLLSVIYGTGVFVAGIRLMGAIVSMLRLKKRSVINRAGRFTIIRTDLGESFSFFHLIFIPKHQNNPLILEHEKVHVKQFHWIDLIIVEAVSLILWFNPLIIFYKRAIKLQHEYLADAGTLAPGGKIKPYVDCLLQQMQNKIFAGPASPFYSTSIKKRILMMTRQKTSLPFSVLYLMAVPFTGFLLMAFASHPEVSPKANTFFKTPEPFAVMPVNDIPSISPVVLENVKRISLYGGLLNWLTNEMEFHKGVDFELAEGSEIVATADGIVVDARFNARRGNYIVIRHGEIYSTHYSHLKMSMVNPGDAVKKGEVIGLVGATGAAHKPHLYYEVFKNGQLADPQEYLPKLENC